MTFIDFTIFLGMHADDNQVRIACKNTFVRNFEEGLYISLDHVGMCDHLVWRYPYDTQTKYYPFMDALHSRMNLKRFAYTSETMKIACDERYNLLGALYGPLLSVVKANHGSLLSLEIRSPSSVLQTDVPSYDGVEHKFEEDIEMLYQTSRSLVVSTSLLKGTGKWKELLYLL